MNGKSHNPQIDAYRALVRPITKEESAALPPAYRALAIDPLTLGQAVILSAFTGTLCCDFSTYHKYVEHLLGRPVWTHEMGDPRIAEQIKEAARGDFLKLNPN